MNATANRIEKWPNIVTIGFSKCGTGALAFIDCHPDIVFRLVEPSVFNNKQVSLESYNIPKATLDEVLIEKSPTYVKGGDSALYKKARLMKQKIPDLKILVFLCDPIKRLYSHIKMDYEDQRKRQKYWGKNVTVESVWATAEDHAAQRNVTELSTEHNDTLRQKLKFGKFYSKLLPWIKVFGYSQIHLVDGDNLGNDLY